MIADLWGAVRSFADGGGGKAAHLRWLELKNLSHIIANHPDPMPYWEYLKTALVQEMASPQPVFRLGGLKLKLEAQCSGPGLQWGPPSYDNSFHVQKEVQWYLGGSEGPLLGPSEPPFGWRKPGYLADQGLLRGISWNVSAYVKSPRVPTIFLLPLHSGHLGATTFNEEDEALTERWRQALLVEERTVWGLMTTPLVKTRTEAWLQEPPVKDEVDGEWARGLVTLLQDPQPLERDQVSLSQQRERAAGHLARRYVSERQTGWTSQSRNPVSPLIESALLRQYPHTSEWGGAARSVLGRHALQSFIDTDRRGRAGLQDLFLQSLQEGDERRALLSMGATVL